MLRYKYLPVRFSGKPFRVANSRSIALGWGKRLIRLIRIVAPDTATGVELRAGIQAGRFQHSISHLAGISRGRDIDIHCSVHADDEWMHGMIAAQRQSGDNGLPMATRYDGVC